MTNSSPDLTTGQDWNRGQPAAARPAATVIVGRDGHMGLEVLMVRRRSGGTFGGLWVFPGGRVDPEDYVAAGIPPGDALAADQEIAVGRVAAVREAREEANLHLDADALVAHSHWMPPAEAGRRYSTWFFVGPAPAGEVVVDEDEVREHLWVRPAEGMGARDAGELPLAPPTWMTLWQLAAHPSIEAAVAAARAAEPHRFETRMEARPDGVVFYWAGDAAFGHGHLDRPGSRLRLHAPEAGPWRLEMSPPGQLVGGA